ncbi:MAG: PD40 domain-containing protein [Chloroflexi bacterium]|nr:PD40 domain-containing protein [Chloroflexota bacterium]
MNHRSPLLFSCVLLVLAVLAGCSPAATSDPNLPSVQTLEGLASLPALAALDGPAGTVTLAVVLTDKLEVAQIDMASGAVTLLFTSPANIRLNGLAAGTGGAPTLLAYAPPPAGGLQSGLSGLYTLPDSGELEQWVGLSETETESYLHPAWSPDGESVVYTHYRALGTDASQPFIFQIERRAYPDGEPEILAENAIRPALSPDGQWLAYLVSRPDSTDTPLYIASADGRDPRPLLDPELYPMTDAPVFSPDGQWVYFTLPHAEEDEDDSGGWDPWGVRSAHAHGAAYNWWRMPVAGGEPEQLTDMETSVLHGALSPDGEWLLSTSDQGLFLVNLASGEVTFLLKGMVMFSGMVGWRP